MQPPGDGGPPNTLHRVSQSGRMGRPRRRSAPGRARPRDLRSDAARYPAPGPGCGRYRIGWSPAHAARRRDNAAPIDRAGASFDSGAPRNRAARGQWPCWPSRDVGFHRSTERKAERAEKAECSPNLENPPSPPSLPSLPYTDPYASTGGQLHTRFLSPNALSIRPTVGQTLCSRTARLGYAARSRG
jgi:hypothetical protein